jgi:hypothetical protein
MGEGALMSDILTTDKDGVRLAEYKGVYSLTSIRIGGDGKMYEQWATYQTGKDKHQPKDWPVKAILGEKDVAVGALVESLREITGKDYIPDEKKPPVTDDVPF